MKLLINSSGGIYNDIASSSNLAISGDYLGSA